MDRNVTVKKSKINKKGVFAARDFKKGEVVLRWKPKIIEESELKTLPNSQRHYLYRAGKHTYYLMQPPERFVNHSCNANTRVKNLSDVAIRFIRKGEEITSDYGKGNPIPFMCECGEKNCRGVID